MTSPTSSASSAGSSSVSADVAAGKLPDDMPPQLEISTWCTNWKAYDVPRIWSSIRDEVQEDAWTQAAGFENLSTLLADHHDRLRALRESLVQSWDPAVSKAAASFLGGVDALLGAMRNDAYAHASTARALQGMLDTLKSARSTVAAAKEKWDAVTTDLLPEWWDHAAEKLNKKAREAMVSMDSSVADHRRAIIVPAPLLFTRQSDDATIIDPAGDSGSGSSSARAVGSGETRPKNAARWSPPPPVPGSDPVLIPPESPSLSGGAAPLTPDFSGPPSALPIPPGNPYVPTGGAYVLPGGYPGQGGQVFPMPIPTAMKSEVAAARALAAREAAGRGGLAPMPYGSGALPAAKGGEGRLQKRVGDLQWEVLQGVPPVIGEIGAEEQDATKEAEHMASLNDVFEDWYASLLNPWDKNSKNGEPRKDDLQ